MNYRSIGKRSFIPHLTTLLVVLLTGCREKKDETPPVAAAVEQSQPQTATPRSTTPAPVAVERKVSEAQQAAKVKDYDRALETLWSPQPAASQITPEQATKLNAAMTEFQGQLAAAAAAGDSKAIAAREKLRLRFMKMP